MPDQNNTSSFELEGVTIDISSLSLRAIVASALSFIPVAGGVLGAIAMVIPVRGRTQHIGVEEAYRYSREFVDRFHSRVLQILTDTRLRVAYSRWLGRKLYNRLRSRYPAGNGLTELERMREISETASNDESYTVYYLAAYYFLRNADAEHLREEFNDHFLAWIPLDLKEFMQLVASKDRELLEEFPELASSAGATQGIALAGIAGLAGLVYFLRR